MTALNGTPGLEHDLGGLAEIPGLETVSEQLAGLIDVLRAGRPAAGRRPNPPPGLEEPRVHRRPRHW